MHAIVNAANTSLYNNHICGVIFDRDVASRNLSLLCPNIRNNLYNGDSAIDYIFNNKYIYQLKK